MTIIQSVIVILIPNVLIGVCGKEHMRCRSLTLPALTVLGIVTLALGVGSSLYLWQSLKVQGRKEQIAE